MINLKKILGVGQAGLSWNLGETRCLPVQQNKGIFDYLGATLITRDSYRNVSAADYPDFYNLTDGYYTDSFFRFMQPSTNGATSFYMRSVETNVNTIIVVGDGGLIARSADGGVTWATIASGTTNNLKLVHYNATLNKWYIYHTTNNVLISNDDGVTFTPTVVTGLAFSALIAGTDAKYLRARSIGNYTVVSCHTHVFSTSNGTTYTAGTLPGSTASGGKLTKGNGWFVLFTSDYKILASATGAGAWTACLSVSGVDSQSTPYVSSYGVVYDDIRWYIGLGGPSQDQINSSSPNTGPVPGPTAYYRNAITAPAAVYTTGVNVGNPTTATWTYKSRTTGGYYITGWQANGGTSNWESDAFWDHTYNGPYGPFGSYLWHGDDRYGMSWSLYAPNEFITLMGNSQWLTTSIAVSGATLYPVDINGQEIHGKTGNDYVFSGLGTNLIFNITLTPGIPSRALAAVSRNGGVGNNVIPGDGMPCTRIK